MILFRELRETELDPTPVPVVLIQMRQLQIQERDHDPLHSMTRMLELVYFAKVVIRIELRANLAQLMAATLVLIRLVLCLFSPTCACVQRDTTIPILVLLL